MAIATWAEAKRATLDALERDYWTRLYTATMGNVSMMAELAGCERCHVRAYARRLGLVLPGAIGPRLRERPEAQRRVAALMAAYEAPAVDDHSPPPA